jgi:hypothetical protein
MRISMANAVALVCLQRVPSSLAPMIAKEAARVGWSYTAPTTAFDPNSDLPAPKLARDYVCAFLSRAQTTEPGRFGYFFSDAFVDSSGVPMPPPVTLTVKSIPDGFGLSVVNWYAPASKEEAHAAMARLSTLLPKETLAPDNVPIVLTGDFGLRYEEFWYLFPAWSDSSVPDATQHIMTNQTIKPPPKDELDFTLNAIAADIG